MNREREDRHPMPGLPGEVFVARTEITPNGRTLNGKPTTSVIPPSPPPSLGKPTNNLNKTLSLIGDLAETEDVLTALAESNSDAKSKIEFCLGRVHRVKNALLTSVTSTA